MEGPINRAELLTLLYLYNANACRYSAYHQSKIS